MANGLETMPPPPRRPPVATQTASATIPAQEAKAKAETPTEHARESRRGSTTKFDKQAESEKTQFNKRVSKRTADVFAILAVKTNVKVPDLLGEAAELLQEKYGKV